MYSTFIFSFEHFTISFVLENYLRLLIEVPTKFRTSCSVTPCRLIRHRRFGEFSILILRMKEYKISLYYSRMSVNIHYSSVDKTVHPRWIKSSSSLLSDLPRAELKTLTELLISRLPGLKKPKQPCHNNKDGHSALQWGSFSSPHTSLIFPRNAIYSSYVSHGIISSKIYVRYVFLL